MYRKTYVEVNLNHITHNVKTCIQKHPEYTYYIGVVKADSYGHYGIKPVKAILKGGCNYLAVSSLEEALSIRRYLKDIPILCLGIIPIEDIPTCIQKDITITLSNLDYVYKLLTLKDISSLKMHLKINTGMNRLGFNKRSEIKEVYTLLKENHLSLEGIYTHIYEATNHVKTNTQWNTFEELTKDIPLKEIPIIHIGASDAIDLYPKKDYVNACRLGIIQYGLQEKEDKDYKDTFTLKSTIIQINEVDKGSIGYNGTYKVNKKERIAIVPIGYADGIIRKNTGRMVYIHNQKYPIVGNICMDMLFVKVDNTIQVGDQVILIKDRHHIQEIAKYLDTISYEVMCSIGKRVPRTYIEKD